MCAVWPPTRPAPSFGPGSNLGVSVDPGGVAVLRFVVPYRSEAEIEHS